MDNDSFQPAFVTAARVLGLEAFAAKFIKTAGILLEEREFFTKEGNAISWAIPKEATKIGAAIYGTIASAGVNAIHAIVLEASPEGEWPARLEISGPGPRLPLTNHRIEFGFGPKISNWILMDGEGRSDFVRGGFGQHGYVVGEPFVIGPGEVLEIKHGLGFVPKGVFFQEAANSNVNLSLESFNNTFFRIKNQHPSFGAFVYPLIIC